MNLREVKTGDNGKYGSDLFMANRAILYTFNNQRPVSLQLLATPTHFEEFATDLALYAQDQWTIRRVTVNLGLRYNDVDMSSPALISPAGFFVGERRIPAADHIPHWRNVSPRLGAAYDLFGTGKTAIKGSFGRYPDVIRVSPANPANLFSLTTNRTWNDTSFGVGDARSGNFAPDCDLLNPAANGECGAWSDQNFGRPRLSTRNAPDSLEGFNKQFYNWQAGVSFQHELTQGLALNFGYFRTWCGGYLVTNNEAVPANGYDSCCITAPSDSRLPGGGGNQICGLSTLSQHFSAGLTIWSRRRRITAARNRCTRLRSHPQRAIRRGRAVLRRPQRRAHGHGQLLHQRQRVADGAGVPERHLRCRRRRPCRGTRISATWRRHGWPARS